MGSLKMTFPLAAGWIVLTIEMELTKILTRANDSCPWQEIGLRRDFESSTSGFCNHPLILPPAVSL